MYEKDYRDTASLTPYQQRTLTELRRSNRKSLKIAQDKRYELLGNSVAMSVSHPRSVALGSNLQVVVDVTNKISGHSLPTGFTAERQLWVSMEIRDPHGRLVLVTGDLDQNGDLRDEHSHAVLSGKVSYDRLLLSFQNKFATFAQKGTENSVVIPVNRQLTPLNVLRPATGIAASFGRPATLRIAKTSLPPLATIGKSYSVQPRYTGNYQLHVRLNFRHLPPTLFDHIGIPHLKHLLEVVILDEYEATIPVHP